MGGESPPRNLYLRRGEFDLSFFADLMLGQSFELLHRETSTGSDELPELVDLIRTMHVIVSPATNLFYPLHR